MFKKDRKEKGLTIIRFMNNRKNDHNATGRLIMQLVTVGAGKVFLHFFDMELPIPLH